jgi:hypothetical protein
MRSFDLNTGRNAMNTWIEPIELTDDELKAVAGGQILDSPLPWVTTAA